MRREDCRAYLFLLYKVYKKIGVHEHSGKLYEEAEYSEAAYPLDIGEDTERKNTERG